MLGYIHLPRHSRELSSSGPCSSLTVSLNYPLFTKPIYAAFANENILDYPSSRMSGSATWCGLPTWSAWIWLNMRMLNAASASTWIPSWDTYFTAIQSWCKLFCIAPLFANLASYEWQWLCESLKIRTTLCLISKQIRAVQTRFKKPSF